MDDESYESIFVPIISKVMETFQPSAVVLQCGADSLTGTALYVPMLNFKGRKVDSNLAHTVRRRSIRLLQLDSKRPW